MDITETRLTPDDEFPFPFTPYGIQKDFMRNLYEALEGKKLGIFESPTGTGKSMSLICGSLKWLFDAQKRLKDDVVLDINRLNEELQSTTQGANWLDEHASLVKSKQKRDALQDFLNKIISMEKRLEEIKDKSGKLKEKAKRNYGLKPYLESSDNKSIDNQNEEEDDSDFLLDNYNLGGDSLNDEYSSSSEVETKTVKNYYGIKVFVSSRTHSQLSQLLGEIQKSPYKDLEVRVVTLASRQSYCINKSVLKLKHLPLINEKCQELLNKKKGKITKTSANGEPLKRQKTTRGCPFYHQANIENIKTRILTEIMDIEQLIHWGKHLNGCPYYASRKAIDEAQIVLAPYNTILQKNTRLACGINLQNSVVIIDEAHNLLDAIGSIHSCQISGLQMAQSYNQLVLYRDKYSEKFTAMNLLHLNQLIFILNKLLKKIGGTGGGIDSGSTPQSKSGVEVETVAEFMLTSGIDTINFHQILEFVTKSNLVNKLRGFLHKYSPSVTIHKTKKKGVSAFLETLTRKKETAQEVEKVEGTENINGNPIMNVVNFIQILTNHSLDGRIISTVNRTVGTSSVKYILLNPASQFRDIIKDARSVILAGGTMQPISEFTDQLFYLAGGTPDRLSVFTCGHIIPQDNILPVVVSQGPSGKTFHLSYQHRNDVGLQDEFGRLLINITNVVPAGIVCFFPSYDYESQIYERLEKTKVIEKLSKKKKVLREPKKSNEVDKVLKEYAEAAREQGALLFSVVGGKLSEGLNFSDDLGRCIIILGLPYPNLTSVDLKEKMKYLNNEVGPTAGKRYYENLCMKAVNQTIGRSIRHKEDYASVLLIDERFSTDKCAKALPEWIQKSLRKEETFGRIIGLLARFFAAKRKPQERG